MEQRALEKLGLDEDEVNEIAPIVFHGYRYKGTDYAKQGKDGLWRTNKYEVVVMYFSHNEVHCYKYMFTTTSKQQSESTDIYFYRDIVSVSTASESVKFQDEFISYEAFRLTTTGGTALSVSLQDADDAQRSINAMRQLIREKKQ